MKEREYHYCDSGERQYWEYVPLIGWYEVSPYVGDDWNGDTYRYIRWGPEIPTAKRGFPPRIWI